MQLFGSTVNDQIVTLSRYSRIVGYTEWAFFGLSHPDNDRYEIRKIWNLHQREDIASYLDQAQDMIEDVVGFPLKPRWIAGEKHPFNYSVLSNFCKIIELGIQATSDISLGATVTLSAVDCTVTITPISSALDPNEVYVFNPGTEEKIDTKSVVISVTGVPGIYQMVITIPRSRLLKYTLWDTPISGLDALDDNNFEDTVDVKRIYNDTSDLVDALYQTDCITSFSSETSEQIDSFIENYEIGHFIMRHDRCHANCHCQNYAHISLNYRAGLKTSTRIIERTVVRLAHSLMAEIPCAEPILQNLWNMDRNIPKILTRERIDCPFGMMDGAWNAWVWANGQKVFRASILGGARK